MVFVHVEGYTSGYHKVSESRPWSCLIDDCTPLWNYQAARPLVTVFNGTGEGKVADTKLPAVFTAPIRSDVGEYACKEQLWSDVT